MPERSDKAEKNLKGMMFRTVNVLQVRVWWGGGVLSMGACCSTQSTCCRCVCGGVEVYYLLALGACGSSR